jgi:hypothetical protein
MSALRAVVPAHIARKWNAIALRHLADAVLQLDQQAENERHWRQIAEDQADMWQRTAEIYQDGGDVGLTVDGAVVEVRQ